MADTKISALTSVSTYTGSEEVPMNQSGTTKKGTLLDNFRAMYKKVVAPVYVSGRYYTAHITGGTGAAVGANTLRLCPFVLEAAVSISELALKATAGGSTATNILLGIYATDPTTGLPTGTPVVQLASALTGATASGSFSSAVSGGSVTLQPGIYWGGVLTDNGTVTLLNPAYPPSGKLAGATSLANLFPGNGTYNGLSATQTYASGLPDLTTPPSYSYNNGNAQWLVAFKVA